jgi:hypothetical protein
MAMNLMNITADEKRRMVEYGVTNWKLSQEFVEWLIEEFEQVYTKILEQKLKEVK